MYMTASVLFGIGLKISLKLYQAEVWTTIIAMDKVRNMASCAENGQNQGNCLDKKWTAQKFSIGKSCDIDQILHHSKRIKNLKKHSVGIAWTLNPPLSTLWVVIHLCFKLKMVCWCSIPLKLGDTKLIYIITFRAKSRIIMRRRNIIRWK